jgi:hypothetical protein
MVPTKNSADRARRLQDSELVTYPGPREDWNRINGKQVSSGL